MVQAIPEGVGNIVPYLCVRGAKKAIEFYQAAFDAQVMSVMPFGDDLVGHADLKIGGSRLYLADEMPGFGAVKSPSSLKGATANIHLWVEDCDAAFARAVAAGAKVVMPLTDQFWGDRYGMVSDPFGQVWAITSHREDLTPEEMTRRGQEAMAQMAQAAPPARKARPRPRRKKASPKPKPRLKVLGDAIRSEAAAPASPAAAMAEPSRDDKAGKKGKKGKKDKKDKKDKSGKKGKSGKSKKSKKDKKRKKKSKR